MSGENAVVHNSRRCPECESFGKIVDVSTMSTTGSITLSDADRVRDRTFECYDCDTNWVHYHD